MHDSLHRQDDRNAVLSENEVDVAEQYNAVVRQAREHLIRLQSCPTYIPTVVASGVGTDVATLLLYGVAATQRQFRTRHMRERLQFLRPFIAQAEYDDLAKMIDGSSELASVRKHLMYVHRQLIDMYKQIVVGFSETKDFEGVHIPGIDD